MNCKIVVLACFLFALSSIHHGACFSIGNNLEICPDYSKAVNLTYDVLRTASPNIFGIATLNIRVPEDDLLSEPITCVLIIDQVHDGTGGDVTIMNGGVGSEYVEIHITSKIWRGLKYKVQVFTAGSSTRIPETSSSPIVTDSTSGNSSFPAIPTSP
ncbi:unnamed protein product, partial [Phaedon cochleariae]